MKSSSQDSDSSSKREECIYLGEDGRMHNAYIDQFKIIKDAKIESISPTTYENGVDSKGNWSARARFTVKRAEPVNPAVFGIDTGTGNSISRRNDEGRTSEIMDF